VDKNFFWVFIGVAFALIFLIPSFPCISISIIIALIVGGMIVWRWGRGTLKKWW